MNKDNKTIHWINVILDKISKLDDNKGVELLHACGGECAVTSEFLAGAVKIRNEYINEDDPDKLFKVFKLQYYNTSELIKEGNKIILVFKKCTCPMAKEGVNNPYLCNCTVGYTKKIFETLFDRAVKVDLEKSILKGDKICRQVIDLQ